jgi:hypothetical protein
VSLAIAAGVTDRLWGVVVMLVSLRAADAGKSGVSDGTKKRKYKHWTKFVTNPVRQRPPRLRLNAHHVLANSFHTNEYQKKGW